MKADGSPAFSGIIFSDATDILTFPLRRDRITGMGVVSFLIPESISPEARRCLDRACLAGGYDLTPAPTARTIEGNRLSLSKDANESGYLLLPWPVAGFGRPVSMSATLRENIEPYHLLVELVRGKLNHLRNQTAEWESIGLELGPDLQAEVSVAIQQFGQLVSDTSPPTDLAQDVLERAYRLAARVTQEFVEQLLATRLTESGRLGTRLGCRIASLPPASERAEISQSFNAIRVVPDWSRIEANESNYDWTALDAVIDWATSSGMHVSLGPLIDLAHGPFPSWLQQSEGDLPSLAAFMCDYAETIVHRYRDRVRTWQAFAGFNHTDSLGLSEDDRLRLAARLLESLRQADPDADVIIGLAQPWGDYLAVERHSYSPIVFADTLMRAGFLLGGIELELLSGPGERPSAQRDLLDTFRVLDLIGVLGVPIEVMLGAAADIESPDQSAAKIKLAAALPHIRAAYWETWAKSPGDRIAASQLNGTQGPLLAELRSLKELYLI